MFRKFTKAVIKHGFEHTQSDHTLFTNFTRAGRLTFLIVYVDDIILIGNDFQSIKLIKEHLPLEFEIKDLGNLRYFLGMEVGRTKNTWCITKEVYSGLILERRMLGCKPALTLIKPGHKPKELWDKTPTDKLSYQKILGKLIYLSHTGPDIYYVVSS